MKMVKAKRIQCSILTAGLGIYLAMGHGMAAQTPIHVNPRIHVAVDLVQLNVAVTDSRGNYVAGLQPEDFTVLEDGIPQKIAPFPEGEEAVPILTRIVHLHQDHG